MSTKPGTLALASAAMMLAALAAPAVAATTQAGVPTFQEYRDSVAHLDTDGQYIVNGDEPVGSVGRLRRYYDLVTGAGAPALLAPDTHLVVNTVAGRDDRWPKARVGNLTYCVSTRFGTVRADLVAAMDEGVAMWEAASSAIDFVHVTSADARCTVRNTAVVFSVEPTRTTQYVARAFFPSTPDLRRNILVNAGSLLGADPWTPGNIMGHELGHVLGFRHEHTRPEAGLCFEDISWRPLTPYDSASIMHYPQCNGSSEDLSMTDQDRAGAVVLYGP